MFNLFIDIRSLKKLNCLIGQTNIYHLVIFIFRHFNVDLKENFFNNKTKMLPSWESQHFKFPRFKMI